jgi:hypothetical protein
VGLSGDGVIEHGRAALRIGDGAGARRCFEAALGERESGAALEGLAEAVYLEREYAASAAHYERAYAAIRERENMAAGRAARTLAWITGNVLGNWAVQSGWLARARSTAQGITDAFRDAELCATALDETFSGARDFDGRVLRGGERRAHLRDRGLTTVL